ncbi:glycosyltransferase family 9 protein [Guyparkeria sp. TX1]|uniref:glycosyltransferase family 9 protein n=1 Tax=Guyparkeria sp. TX1 TaxID=3115001 RepID=UPI003977558C
MRIAIVAPDLPDEVIPTFPALTDAVRARPGLKFSVITGPEAAGWFRRHPDVDEVVVFDGTALLASGWTPAGWRASRAWKDTLRAHPQLEQVEYVIDPFGRPETLAMAKRVPATSVGIARPTKGRLPRRQPYDSQYPVPDDLHRVQAVRVLFAAVLEYSLHDLNPDYGLSIEAEPVVTDLLVDTGCLPFEEAGIDLIRRRLGETGVSLDDVSAHPPGDMDEWQRRLTQSRYVLVGNNRCGWLAAALGIPGVCVCRDGEAKHEGVITTRRSRQKLINVDHPPMNQPEIVVESIIQVITQGKAPIELPEEPSSSPEGVEVTPERP